MSRSIKKGPYVHPKLTKKVEQVKNLIFGSYLV